MLLEITESVMMGIDTNTASVDIKKESSTAKCSRTN